MHDAPSPNENDTPAASVDTEHLMTTLNNALAPLERKLTASFDVPRQPTIFIVGAPRSGTTLLAQLLIGAYEIGYVNNLAARFWNAPYLGMQLVAHVRDETKPPAVGVRSDLGATSGYEGPHEFGHFWRRWFAYGATHVVDEEELQAVDTEFFQRECAAMESVSGGPFLFKNLVCSFQIPFLAEVLPQALFIHCRRAPLYAAQSLLRARKRYCGSREKWFSVKPAAYPSLRKRPYAEQIAGQIFYTRRHVEENLQDLPTHRFCRVDYESLVEQPEDVLRHVADFVKARGTVKARENFTVPVLSSTNELSIDDTHLQRLRKSCRQFFGE